MIRKNKDRTSFAKEMFGGPGLMKASQILNADEFCGKGRLFNHVVLEPGSGVGLHRHKNDFEVYYLLKGTATYNDNGREVEVGPGDVMVCPDGEEHSIVNTGTTDVEMIALILFS